jgi:hypothetical protein
LIEDDYQRTINLDNGVDKVLAKFNIEGTSVNVTDSSGTVIGTRKKTFAELDDAIPDEKKQKDMLRVAALRHTIDVRYDLSSELGKKTGEPPRQVTTQDLDKISRRSWADAAVSEGIKTEQAQKALTEKNPNDPLDEPVTPEELADAQKDAKTDAEKAKKQTAIRKIMAKLRKGGKAAAIILGVSVGALLLLGMTAGGAQAGQ